MLSYQWDDQALVKKIYNRLKDHGLPVWMDIEGGVTGNINDSWVQWSVFGPSITTCDTMLEADTLESICVFSGWLQAWRRPWWFVRSWLQLTRPPAAARRSSTTQTPGRSSWCPSCWPTTGRPVSGWDWSPQACCGWTSGEEACQRTQVTHSIFGIKSVCAWIWCKIVRISFSETQNRMRSSLRCVCSLWRRRSCLTPVTSWQSRSLRGRWWMIPSHRSPAWRRNRADGFAMLSRSSTSTSRVDIEDWTWSF